MIMFATAASLDLKGWLRGLLGAGISGGAGAVTAGFVVSGVDSEHFGVYSWHFYQLIATVFCASFIVSVAKFLMTQPLPAVKTVEKITETTQVGAKAPVVVETLKETTVSALPPKTS